MSSLKIARSSSERAAAQTSRQRSRTPLRQPRPHAASVNCSVIQPKLLADTIFSFPPEIYLKLLVTAPPTECEAAIWLLRQEIPEAMALSEYITKASGELSSVSPLLAASCLGLLFALENVGKFGNLVPPFARYQGNMIRVLES